MKKKNNYFYKKADELLANEQVHDIVITRRATIHQLKQASFLKKKYDLSDFAKNKLYRSPEWGKLKKWFYSENEKVCHRCGSLDDIHLDHILPISTNPKKCLDYKNIQPLCGSCNYQKSNISTREMRPLVSGDPPRDIILLKGKHGLFFPRI